MKASFFLALAATAQTAGAFQVPSLVKSRSAVSLLQATTSDESVHDSARKDFLKTVSVAAAATLLWDQPQPAHARGRATLERAYERYTPRIREGAAFYGSDLRTLVGRSDWSAIKSALQEPPERQAGDLSKVDGGVADRAKLAGQFSDARVVVAMDLYAAAFSDNSISAKTKKMKAAVEKVRAAVEGMSSVAKQALGEEGGGGFFGLGAKKPSDAELQKKMREYYVAGGNAFNEYILAANEDLALQFDKLSYIGA